MLRLSRRQCSNRYTPIVGCAFLVELLYGSQYSAHLGTYHMPYMYVKTILLCAAGHGLELREGRYIHGLIEALLPSTVSQDSLTKVELLQFVDAVPVTQADGPGEEEEEDATPETTATEMLTSSGAASASPAMAAATENERRQNGNHAGAALHGVLSTASLAGGGTGSAVLPMVEGEEGKSQAEADSLVSDAIMSLVSAAAFPSSIAPVLLYDAVCTCAADGGYSAKEKERVALVSSQIGLSSAVRSQIEKLALQEKVIANRKRRLLLLHHPRHSLAAESHRRDAGLSAARASASSLHSSSAAPSTKAPPLGGSPTTPTDLLDEESTARRMRNLLRRARASGCTTES